MHTRLRRILYVVVCVVVLTLWIEFGRFEAIELPYVEF